VRPGAALLDQPVPHGARQRDVRERAAFTGVVKMPELPAPHLEHRPAEAWLGRELDALPVRDLANERIHGDASVEARLLQSPIGHAGIMQLQVHLKSNG